MKRKTTPTTHTATASNPANTEPEFYAEAANRLLRNGTVTEKTTFAELAWVMQQDEKQREAIAEFKAFFDSFDTEAYTVADAELAVDLLAQWVCLDPAGFDRYFQQA